MREKYKLQVSNSKKPGKLKEKPASPSIGLLFVICYLLPKTLLQWSSLDLRHYDLVILFLKKHFSF